MRKNYFVTCVTMICLLVLVGCTSLKIGTEVPGNTVTESQGAAETGSQEKQEVQKPTEAETQVVEKPTETEKPEVPSSETTEVQENGPVMPLPVTVDLDHLNDCTVAISLDKGDVYTDKNGAVQMDATVYVYDLYDMVDISLLEEGDTIVIRNQEVPVTNLERNELGLVIINGGEENGGYDFYTDNSGVYFEMGFNDAKAYYPLGEATIRVSADFEFYDSSDLEAGEKMFYPGDFLIDDAGIRYDFNANNTTIVIEEGQIIQMNRIYTP